MGLVARALRHPEHRVRYALAHVGVVLFVVAAILSCLLPSDEAA